MCKWFLLIDLFALELQQWSWDIVTIFVSPRSQNMIRFHMFSASLIQLVFTKSYLQWDKGRWSTGHEIIDEKILLTKRWQWPVGELQLLKHINICMTLVLWSAPGTVPTLVLWCMCVLCAVLVFHDLRWYDYTSQHPSPPSPPTHQLLHTLYPSKHVQQQVDHISSQDC